MSVGRTRKKKKLTLREMYPEINLHAPFRYGLTTCAQLKHLFCDKCGHCIACGHCTKHGCGSAWNK